MNGVIYYEKFLIIAILTSSLYSQDISPDLVNWRHLFTLKQKFFHLFRERLNEPEYHSRCVKLIHDRYDILNVITQMKATAQEAMGFLYLILEEFNFPIPTNFEVSVDNKLYPVYEEYFTKFAREIVIRENFSSIASDLPYMNCVTIEGDVTLSDVDIALFKDLLAVHIAILLKVPVPKLKKEGCCLL
ncbi:hypothetical protein A3F66_06895 [candidate division TM6 bacterium RIFCSPHIGHO2_12_FULL_32_22]|nr:MAG: hypothetical protein A3F66_06895 [candidate division TM6 bacterium RIFCSPHIGHO2_12_FULL_32_22]